MNCVKCKKEIPEESLFCLYCGESTHKEKSSKSASPRNRKKRANGSGSVYKLSGRRRKPWVAVTTSYKNQVRKTTIIGYYTTQKDAAAALVLIDPSRIPADFNATLENIYQLWSKEHFKNVGIKSVEGYETAWKHLTPCKDIKMRDIKTSDFQNIIDRLKQSRGRSTCNGIRILANQLCKYAMEHDIVQKNYAQYIKLPKTKKSQEKSIFSKQEIKILFGYKNEQTAQIILTLIYSGMRIGELFGIEKKNVFLEQQYMIGGEKTEAGINRIIPIHNKVLPFIKAWYEKDADSKFLLSNSKGGKMNIRNFRERHFYPFLETIGLLTPGEKHRLTPHSTRHTFASMMVQADAKPELLQKIIGHESYETTIDFYTHFTQDDVKIMLNQVNSI